MQKKNQIKQVKISKTNLNNKSTLIKNSYK